MTSANRAKLNRSGRRALLSPYRAILIQGICYFVSAGNWGQPRIWLYFSVFLAGAILSTGVALRYLKELYNVRGSRQTGAKKWDLVLLICYFSVQLVFMPIVAGLDIRFNGARLGSGYVVAGVLIYVVAHIIIQWAILSNRHFEGLVRIQRDRHHEVVTAGPYRLVRHPGYSGMILLTLVLPFLAGSPWALVTGVISMLLLVLRTYLEDKTLQRELDGYAAYSATTRFRLIPAIW